MVSVTKQGYDIERKVEVWQQGAVELSLLFQ